MRKFLIISAIGLLLAICFIREARGDELFFKDWGIEEAVQLPNGNIGATLNNPDPEGAIKKVKLVVSPQGVLWYAYFENGEIKLFIAEEEGYKQVPLPENCLKCHKPKEKI